MSSNNKDDEGIFGYILTLMIKFLLIVCMVQAIRVANSYMDYNRYEKYNDRFLLDMKTGKLKLIDNKSWRDQYEDDKLIEEIERKLKN